VACEVFFTTDAEEHPTFVKATCIDNSNNIVAVQNVELSFFFAVIDDNTVAEFLKFVTYGKNYCNFYEFWS
jgi:hypothetical protein